MNIAIIKYNAGNVQSVLYALARLNLQAEVTDDPEKLRAADKVIFPGVGEASTAMTYLRARKLDAIIHDLQQPVLGICLGMQLLCAHSDENDTSCIGIFEESVKRFTPADKTLKVPQIGWNSITDLNSILFREVSAGSYVYSVHSYYVSKGEHTIATSEYGIPYSAAIHKNNFYGVQFHPEKSAAAGLQVLKNFLLS